MEHKWHKNRVGGGSSKGGLDMPPTADLDIQGKSL